MSWIGTGRMLRFVRYADDFSIYTKRKSDAETTMKVIENFLRIKLKLTIVLHLAPLEET